MTGPYIQWFIPVEGGEFPPETPQTKSIITRWFIPVYETVFVPEGGTDERENNEGRSAGDAPDCQD